MNREDRKTLFRAAVIARGQGTTLKAVVEAGGKPAAEAAPRVVVEKPAPARVALARVVADEIAGMSREQLVTLLALSRTVQAIPPVPSVDDRQAVLPGMEGHVTPAVPDLSGASTLVERLLVAVASHYGLTPDDLKAKSNAHAIARPRQVAIYLLKRLTRMSYPQIGRLFGGKHHTTAMHAVDKVAERMDNEPEFRQVVEALQRELAA